VVTQSIRFVHCNAHKTFSLDWRVARSIIATAAAFAEFVPPYWEVQRRQSRLQLTGSATATATATAARLRSIPKNTPISSTIECWLVDWLVGWLVGWSFVVRSFVRSLVGSFVRLFVLWLVGWLVGWFIGWLVHWWWLNGQLIGPAVLHRLCGAQCRRHLEGALSSTIEHQPHGDHNTRNVAVVSNHLLRRCSLHGAHRMKKKNP